MQYGNLKELNGVIKRARNYHIKSKQSKDIH